MTAIPILLLSGIAIVNDRSLLLGRSSSYERSTPSTTDSQDRCFGEYHVGKIVNISPRTFPRRARGTARQNAGGARGGGRRRAMARGRVSVLEMLTGKPLPSKSERDPVARTEDSGDGVELVSATTAAMPKMEPKKRKQDSSSSIRLGSGSGNSRKKWLFRPCSRKRKAPEAKAGERRLGARGNWSRPAPEEARAEVVISDLEDTLLMDLLAFTGRTRRSAPRRPPHLRPSALAGPGGRLGEGAGRPLDLQASEAEDAAAVQVEAGRGRRREDGRGRARGPKTKVCGLPPQEGSAGSALHWEQRYRPW